MLLSGDVIDSASGQRAVRLNVSFSRSILNLSATETDLSSGAAHLIW